MTTTFDYTPLVLRADPRCAPTPGAQRGHQAIAALPLDHDTLDTITGSLPVIAGIWTQLAPDTAALHHMLDVLASFAGTIDPDGDRAWTDVTTHEAARFITDEDALGDLDDTVVHDVQHLRRNTLHAAWLALTDAGLLDTPDSIATGVSLGARPGTGTRQADDTGTGVEARPAKRRDYSQRSHTRPASHDEILLLRLACRLAGTTRSQHLPAATLALCTATATTSEAPRVIWSGLTADTVTLPGRTASGSHDEKAIAPRTVDLDPWQQDTVAAWTEECTRSRTPAGADSVIYRGNAGAASNSAAVSADKQIAKLFAIAGLDHQPGLTAGSLRQWAAVRTVTDFATLEAAAAVAGVGALTLHRQVTHLGERALRPI